MVFLWYLPRRIVYTLKGIIYPRGIFTLRAYGISAGNNFSQLYYGITLVGRDDTCLVCTVCVNIPAGYTLGYGIPWGIIYHWIRYLVWGVHGCYLFSMYSMGEYPCRVYPGVWYTLGYNIPLDKVFGLGCAWLLPV